MDAGGLEKLWRQQPGTPVYATDLDAEGAQRALSEASPERNDVKLVPGQFVKPFLKGQKNDFRDAEAIAEAVQRPTMRFVPTKSVDQLDLQAPHRVRSRLVSQRTAIVNQSRAFLLERGIAVRQGLRFLRQALPDMANVLLTGRT